MSNGAIIWEGKSKLDGGPIVVIATGFRRPSTNEKTGPVIQTWILRADVEPHEAIRSGEDESICGDCPLRGINGQARACYVNPRGPVSIFRAYKAGSYPRLGIRSLRPLLAGRVVRLGSYGDPAAVPFHILKRITNAARRHTGYTHAWRKADSRFRKIVMASCDSPADFRRARRKGWRTFRVQVPGSPLLPGEISCPASEEAGKRTTCEQCKLCDGVRYRHDPRRSIAIVVHGRAGSKNAFAESFGV